MMKTVFFIPLSLKDVFIIQRLTGEKQAGPRFFSFCAGRFLVYHGDRKMIMRAIFIAVGSEMLDQDRLDTNSLYVARKLREKGILTDMKVVVGDNRDYLSWILRKALGRSQLVIVSGGLGPTDDDVTREAAAVAVKRELVYREELLVPIRELFRRRGVVMPEINTRQAFIVDGAEVIPNPVGTAPGQYVELEGTRLLLLPGVPFELKPMFDAVLDLRLASLCSHHVYQRSLMLAGITESEADSRISDLNVRSDLVQTTILASPGRIELHLLGRSRLAVDEVQRAVDERVEELRRRLADHVFAEGDVTLEEIVVSGLRRRRLTLAVAESCSGGLLGDRLTSVPGASEVFRGGVIAYDNALKATLLGVPAEVLEAHGAVSGETAAEMACGARRATGADIGLALTGIAGPGGATPRKPVGLVFAHLSAEGVETGLYRTFGGDRQTVKLRAVYLALQLAWEHLKNRAE
jgi:nicotinamide-nucleotide amidase